MNSAECLVACLENEGVQYIFGLPGEETLALYEAVWDRPIRMVTCRHEQGAAFMADVHGRLTGRPGVCVSTLGPGATNLVTGVADADMDRAPLVAITGQASLDRTHKESHQFLELVSLFRPVTKWNAQIKLGSVVPEMVRHAFREATWEKPGATHLVLPEDVAEEHVPHDATPLPVYPLPHPVPPESQLQRAAELLSQSQSPLILAGNGVIRASASDSLQHFARAVNIPVAHTFMAKGVFPPDDPLAIMTAGIQERDYVACGFEAADLVICIGYDATEYAPKSWNPNRDKPVLHIAGTPAESDAYYPAKVEVVGAINSALEYLAEHVPPRQASSIARLHDPIVNEIRDYENDPAIPFKPQRVLADLAHVLDPEDIIVSDVGAHKVWLARIYPTRVPNTCLISNGFASMGIAVPGAIAAKLLYPHRRVVAFAGDGGALMNIQELETAVRLNTPIALVVLVDGMYGLIEWKQQRAYGHSTNVGIGNPDWVKLVESFGGVGTRVESSDGLLPALRWAVNQERTTVVEVPLDFRENLRLTEQLGELVCPV